MQYCNGSISIDLSLEDERIDLDDGNYQDDARNFVCNYLENRKHKGKEAIKVELQELQRNFESIRARVKWVDFSTTIKFKYTCYVEIQEYIVVDKLFDLFKYNQYLNIKEKKCTCCIDFQCTIYSNENIDTSDNRLLRVQYSEEEICIDLSLEDERIIFDKGDYVKEARDFIYYYLENRKVKHLGSIIEDGIRLIEYLSILGTSFEEKVCSALKSSHYIVEFPKVVDCLKNNNMLIINYELPHTSNLLNIKGFQYVISNKELKKHTVKKHSDRDFSKLYEDMLYSITLRSLYEIFFIDSSNEIQGITFNGFITQINPSTGNTERKCILSIQVEKNKFSELNLSQVEPKACFKTLKGVSAAKLIDFSPVTPILIFNKEDRRFVDGKDISVNQGTNLAAMYWEDFEHLVRELFEMEFAKYGGEVHVTQASRDGGVDAIIFDPDPIRGGKIVIQAKRYTNTVGVSAVRDLYGTVINEGANTGILITTSDYGHDSYEFAKGKPLKLLNGCHLLALLRKNGRNAHINIEEAKKINEMHYGK